MEIFRRGRGWGCFRGDRGDGQRLVGFTSQQLVSEGDILNRIKHTHCWSFRNALAHNVCVQTHHFECTHKKIHSYVHIDARLLVYSLCPIIQSLFFSFFVSSLAFSISPSFCFAFFLPGWCFPLPTVMLICAVIRREGLNTAF